MVEQGRGRDALLRGLRCRSAGHGAVARGPACAAAREQVRPGCHGAHDRAAEPDPCLGRQRADGEVAPLSVEISRLGKEKMVFQGDAKHVPLWHRNVVAGAALPSQAGQVRPGRLCDDLRRDQAHRPGGLPAGDPGVQEAKTIATLYDPQEGTSRPLAVAAPEAASLEIAVPLVDHPRLLMLSE